MNKREIELCIQQALDDPSILGEPALRRVLEHTFSHSREEFRQQDLFPPDVLGLFATKLLLEAYPSSRLTLARGLLLFHIRFFDLIYSQESIKAVFQAVKAGDPGLVKRLHVHLTDYCTKAGLVPISEGDLAKWMINQMGSVDERTAERHYKEGLDKFYAGLIKAAPGLAGDGPDSQEISSPKGSQTSVTTLEFDLLQALKLAMRDECVFAPAAFGHKIPITKCINRSVGYEDEHINLEEIPGALRGQHGWISGTPGSGRSTLMKQVAYLDACYKDNGQAVYYLSARYVQDPENVDDPLMAIARQVVAQSPQNELTEIREQLKRLDQGGALILLIDDLGDLLQHQQKRVVERACRLTSAYFAVTPERAGVLSTRIKENGESPVRFELPELDGPTRETLAQKLSPHLGIDPTEAVRFLSTLTTEPADLIKTPLGVLAALQSTGAPEGGRGLFLAYQSLLEMLGRRGHKLELVERLDDLSTISKSMHMLGLTLYHFWRHEHIVDDYFRFSERPATTIPVEKIQEALLEDSGKTPSALSISDLLRLPILEHNESSSQVRLRFREFETLLAAIYLFYRPRPWSRIESSGIQSLDVRRAGWPGAAMSCAESAAERVGDLQQYLLTAQQGAVANP